MISRLEYLAHADILLHRKVVGLRAHLQLFFLRLYFMTDGAGRFRADAAVIRASLYAHELQQVSERDVASRLQELHRAGLIKLYAEGDAGYGKVTEDFWQQSDKKRKVRHPAPAPVGPAPSLFDEPLGDESPPAGDQKRAKPGVRVSPPTLTSLQFNSVPSAPRPPAGTDQRLVASCLGELAPLYPKHDLRAALRRARAYVRKQRGEEADVTVGWFVTWWMPGEPEKAPAEAPAPVTEAQRQEREQAAQAWQAEQAQQFARLLAGPEPEKGTLNHALWLEGRNRSTAA